MKEEQRRKLFKAFSQGDTSTTKKFGGMGLGLILSQRIAKKMGSEINFESQWTKGSTFYFQLQASYKRSHNEPTAHISDNAQEILVSKNQGIPTEPIIKEKVTVLIVDDVETSRFLFSEYIKEFAQNIRILEAVNGEQAVEKAKSEKPDIILMDLFMPVLDGLTATKMIRKHEREHPCKRIVIFALTATATKDQERECYQAGMDAYLTKPLKKDQLYKKIGEFWKFKNPSQSFKSDDQQVFDQSINDEFLSILGTLKTMLQRNDLSAIDYINQKEERLVDLGFPNILKKIKKKITDLKYKEANDMLNKISITFPESSKRGQENG